MLVKAYQLTWILITIDWVLVALFRFQDSGKQCSGDFMADRNDAVKFQYVQGLFIYFAGLIVLFIYTLFLLNSFVACFKNTKRT